MEKSKNKEVQVFLEDIMLSNDKQFDILQALRDIVFSIHPEISEKIMYWGIIFSLSTSIWGIFAYKNHISFEFTNGYILDDPEKILEWSWKFRRHLKIKTIWDIENKKVDFFVKQAK